MYKELVRKNKQSLIQVKSSYRIILVRKKKRNASYKINEVINRKFRKQSVCKTTDFFLCYSIHKSKYIKKKERLNLC